MGDTLHKTADRVKHDVLEKMITDPDPNGNLSEQTTRKAKYLAQSIAPYERESKLLKNSVRLSRKSWPSTYEINLRLEKLVVLEGSFLIDASDKSASNSGLDSKRQMKPATILLQAILNTCSV